MGDMKFSLMPFDTLDSACMLQHSDSKILAGIRCRIIHQFYCMSDLLYQFITYYKQHQVFIQKPGLVNPNLQNYPH